MTENVKFIDKKITELQESADKRKTDISECRQQILYLETYSRRENLKFERIPESFETWAQQSASAEDKKKVLVNFIEDALGLEDAKGIEFQRVHRMGKPRSGSGNGTRSIRFFSGFLLLNTGTLIFFVSCLNFFLLFTSFFFCAAVCRVYLTLNKITY